MTAIVAVKGALGHPIRITAWKNIENVFSATLGPLQTLSTVNIDTKAIGRLSRATWHVTTLDGNPVDDWGVWVSRDFAIPKLRVDIEPTVR